MYASNPFFLTRASPSLKPSAPSNTGWMTMEPFLSIYPHLEPIRTGAIPSAKLRAYPNFNPIATFPVLSMYPLNHLPPTGWDSSICGKHRRTRRILRERQGGATRLSNLVLKPHCTMPRKDGMFVTLVQLFESGGKVCLGTGIGRYFSRPVFVTRHFHADDVFTRLEFQSRRAVPIELVVHVDISPIGIRT